MSPVKSLGNSRAQYNYKFGLTGFEAALQAPVVIPSFIFNSGDTSRIASTSTNDKIVIAYRDENNSNYGTAVVGTVNETDIEFGTPVVFENATTDHIAIAYDSINDRVVIAFEDEGNSNYGTAIVGSVSGNTISFNGSPTVFHYDDTTDIDAVYDINAQRVVIGYRNNGPGGNQAGDYEGRAIVGTVDPSNNTISFGTEMEFSSSRSSSINMVYDTSTRRIVVVYNDNDDNYNGKAIVGQVNANDTMTFNQGGGGPTTFSTANVTGWISATYCSLDSNGRVVISYRDAADSNKGKAIVGTVSGGGINTISFPSSAVEFESNSAAYTSTTYNPKNGKVVISYRASPKIKSIQGTVSGNTINFDDAQVLSDAGLFTSSTYSSTSGKVVTSYAVENTSYGTASLVGVGFTDYIIYGGDVSGLQPGNGRQFHTFIEPGTLTVTGSPVTADVLMVGSGAAGGTDGAGGGTGGGGAGGLLYGTLTLTAGTYSIVVGAATTNGEGTNGNPTTAFGATAQGGGAGGYAGVQAAQQGGSGGGGSAGSPGLIGADSNQTPQVLPYGTLTGYGNTGGWGAGPGTPRAGGGGGGAGAHGEVIPQTRPNTDNGGGPSDGGAGKQYANYTGEIIGIGPLAPQNGWFAGGGGGYQGNGGQGGGGAGASSPGSQASDGSNHTGGGGGGARTHPSPGDGGGRGGSGIVVVRINI